MNCERIAEIARILKPAYDKVEAGLNAAIEGFTNGRTIWEQAVREYNVMAEPYIVELAQLTPNSEATMRTAFAPDPDDPGSTWPDPEFLMKVANYQSFNSMLWTRYSGLYREPTNHFTF